MVLNTNKNWRRPPQCETLPPKMFSTNGSEKDPVAVYKFSVQERPEKMKDPDAPFQGDIAVNIQIFEF